MIEMNTPEFFLTALSGALIGGAIVAWLFGRKIKLYQQCLDGMAQVIARLMDKLERKENNETNG